MEITTASILIPNMEGREGRKASMVQVTHDGAPANLPGGPKIYRSIALLALIFAEVKLLLIFWSQYHSKKYKSNVHMSL